MPRFSIKKKKNNMVLKHFILPVEHFKAILIFSIMTHPITHPRDCRDGDTKRGKQASKQAMFILVCSQ